MKKNLSINNQQGFTLIEIIAVIVILGILAAFAIPKYIDMREAAVASAAKSAAMELSARERLALAHWKLKGCIEAYPSPDVKNASCTGSGVLAGTTGDGISTALGDDWTEPSLTAAGGTVKFQNKTVTFTRALPAGTTDTTNTAYLWTATAVN